MGSGVIAPRILNLGPRWWVVSFQLRSFQTREYIHRYPLYRRLCGPQKPV